MMRKLIVSIAAALGLVLATAAFAQQVAPRAGDTATIVTGGTAVTVISGPVNGCYVMNPLLPADQGIVTAEPAYINPVTTATTTGNGTNLSLAAGATWSCVPGSTVSVSANAATSGHKLTVVRW